MISLETERLILRPWEPEDAGFVLNLYSRWEVQRFIGNHPQVMREFAEAEERIRVWRTMDHPLHGAWAVQLKEPLQPKTRTPLAGTLLLKSIPASGETLPLQPSGDTEIGWHFHPDHWGHGYATEAAAAVLATALHGGLDRVVAVTAPANTASQRVCQRIGMTRLGQTNRYYNALCELFEARAPQPQPD
ncbi:RimJ/RimL family protein N-acetyltransferase [Pseudarthrobacter sp. W1I19]|uniref:GNAT family N-acetyltransferase n=1 Tax=Pseudarthrobacter sp. W1I19 TaxID=3042288 RepID=UPI0027848489|nr:GNAT family N-acetyltransferase [Pseudarthrobacter sp. W1I19]MDQ0921977.1 RimJ/RimL family protein N-acetyltransferase [Pseudarthrobacter sp. W1I19]